MLNGEELDKMTSRDCEYGWVGGKEVQRQSASQERLTTHVQTSQRRSGMRTLATVTVGSMQLQLAHTKQLPEDAQWLGSAIS